MEKDRAEIQRGGGSKVAGMSNFWKTIWGLKVPNPVKIFLWRACNNILPTKDNLKKRGIVQESWCLFCCSEFETIKHILWDCPSATDVWGACGRKVQKSTGEGNFFIDVMEGMMERCTIEELELHAVIARKIWLRRNTVVYGGVFSHPNVLIQEAVSSLNEYREANTMEAMVVLNREPVIPIKWQAPPPGVYKVNWDVAIDSTNRRMGIGIIVRDSLGRVEAARSQTICAVQEPVFAEAQGALCAAEFSRDLGLQSIILEGDSIQVVNALQGTGPNWSRYGQMVADARVVLTLVRRWLIRHTKREANSAAHQLAKAAVKQVMDRVWIEEIPEGIHDVVFLEQSALVY